MRIWLGILLALCLAAGARAKDMSTLYSDEELVNWGIVFPGAIRKVHTTVIEPALVGDERFVVGKITLLFPLRGRNKDLFEFYAEKDAVVLPIQSLKFLHDMIYAYRWLHRGGYDLGTTFEYVNLLKYRSAASFPGKRYPRPFVALQIPHDNLGAPLPDPNLGDGFNSDFRSALYFILVHEIAHIALGHTFQPPAASSDAAIRNELKADVFALDMMERVKVDPAGMAVFFTFMAQWTPTIADFPSTAAYQRYLKDYSSHPLPGLRVKYISAYMHNSPHKYLGGRANTAENIAKVQETVGIFFRLGEQIDDPVLQRKMKEIGQKATLASIRPRPATAR